MTKSLLEGRRFGLISKIVFKRFISFKKSTVDIELERGPNAPISWPPRGPDLDLIDFNFIIKEL